MGEAFPAEPILSIENVCGPLCFSPPGDYRHPKFEEPDTSFPSV